MLCWLKILSGPTHFLKTLAKVPVGVVVAMDMILGSPEEEDCLKARSLKHVAIGIES